MRLTQIIYQSWNGNFSVISIQPGKTFSYKVDNNKKSPTVYSVKFTNFFDRFITKSQRKSETTHHLQQRIVITDKMIDLISDNYSLLQVMSRFGLSLGFGDKTVKEVCELNGVDCRTFLIVVNFMSEGFSRMDGSSEDISIPALIDYLRQAHIYFLDFSLPAIRRKLIEAIDCSQDDVAFLILKFFDEYTREVRKHMDYEEKTVFKYVDALINGNAPRNYQISTFSKHHDQVGEKLTELKNIIIKYCPAKANENLLNAALFDIYACEAGLESHCKVEDYIFVPAILKLERRIRENEK